MTPSYDKRSVLRAADEELDRALCNFCNQAGDPFEPVSKWDEYTDLAFGELCKAYNEWAVARRAIPVASPGGWNVPEGFKLVPVEPTTAMLGSGTAAISNNGEPDPDYEQDARAMYRAMLSAAPPPPSQEQERSPKPIPSEGA